MPEPVACPYLGVYVGDVEGHGLEEGFLALHVADPVGEPADEPVAFTTLTACEAEELGRDLIRLSRRLHESAARLN